MAMHDIDIDLVKARVLYDPETGVFRWINGHRGPVRAGDVAGSRVNGYWRIKIDQVTYLAHRLAWAVAHSEMPSKEIDHINGDPLENRLSNLRLASRAQNCSNVRGVGVRYEPSRRKWLARICVNCKEINLGRYDKEQDALAAYQSAKIKHRGEYARV